LFAEKSVLVGKRKIASVFLLLPSHNMRRPKRGDAVRRARTDKALRELIAGGESRMASRTTNVPESRQALDNMKFEIARQLGVNLKQGYNGNLTSRENGYVGGYMVKKMIEDYEKQAAGVNSQNNNW